MATIRQLLSQEQRQAITVEFHDPVNMNRTQFELWATAEAEKLALEIDRDYPYPEASKQIRQDVFLLEFKRRVENKRLLWEREARRINRISRDRAKAHKQLEATRQEENGN